MISPGSKRYYCFLGLSLGIHLLLLSFLGMEKVTEDTEEIFIPLGTTSEIMEFSGYAEETRKTEEDKIDPDKELGLEEGEEREDCDRSTLIKMYLELVRRKIEENKFFPSFTRNLGLIGNVKLALKIKADGSFSHIRMIRSSGNSGLDRTALNAVAHMSNKIKRPAWAGSKLLSVSFVIKYQYRL